MSPLLIPGVLFVAICPVVYIYRVIHQIKSAKPRVPALTMQEAWDFWIKNKDELHEDNRRIVDLVQRKFTASAIENLREDLMEIERASKEAANPLVLLRTAIMDAVDMSLLNNAIIELDEEVRKEVQARLGDKFRDEDLGFGFLGGSFTCQVLRWYSSLKYDDGSADDWFAWYTDVAQASVGNTVEMLKKHAKGGSPRFEAVLHKTWRQVMDQARPFVLEAPRKTPIREPKNSPGTPRARNESGD